MKFTAREERILEAIKQLKGEGKRTCTRMDILVKIESQYGYSINNYATTFKELEQQQHLKRASRTLDDKGKIRYESNC